jgi:hypothetical protein
MRESAVLQVDFRLSLDLFDRDGGSVAVERVQHLNGSVPVVLIDPVVGLAWAYGAAIDERKSS